MDVDEHALEAQQMNGRRIEPLGLVLILLVPFLLGAGGRDAEARISEAAVAYARGFEPLLRSDPTETERFGVAADDLAVVDVASVHRLKTIDSRFRLADDTRDVDAALVATDLWWVVLSLDSRPRLVVSVEWSEGSADPQAVGLNWVPATRLAAALTQAGSRGATIVYLPEDAPVALGVVDGMTMAMPIATDVLRARLDLPTGPTPVAEYTRSLRQRLDRLSGQAELAAPAPGGGGGQPSSGSPLSGLALATLLLPLGLLVLSAIVPIRELPRHLTRRGHRG
ncbi:MAG: hypothetical protein WCK58_07740 [Chloroflexota bacterium]